MVVATVTTVSLSGVHTFSINQPATALKVSCIHVHALTKLDQMDDATVTTVLLNGVHTFSVNQAATVDQTSTI